MDLSTTNGASAVSEWVLELFTPSSPGTPINYTAKINVPPLISYHNPSWRWFRVKQFFNYVAGSTYNNHAYWNAIHLDFSFDGASCLITDTALFAGANQATVSHSALMFNSNTGIMTKPSAWKPLYHNVFPSNVTVTVSQLPGTTAGGPTSNTISLITLEFSDQEERPKE